MFSVFKRFGGHTNVDNSSDDDLLERARHINTVEINLVRLIKRAQACATQSGGIPKESIGKFRMYLAELRSYLDALNVFHASGMQLRNSRRLPEYARKIDFLSELVDSEKLKLGRMSNTLRRHGGPSVAIDSSTEYTALGKALKREEDHLRALLFESPPLPIRQVDNSSCKIASEKEEDDGSHLRKVDNVGVGVAPIVDKKVQHTEPPPTQHALRRRLLQERRKHEIDLEREQQMQTQLMQELDDMVESLKDNVKKINTELVSGAGSQIIDQIGDAVDANVDSTQREVVRLKDHMSRSSSSTCQSWFLLILVFVMFVFTYIFMRMFGKPKS